MKEIQASIDDLGEHTTADGSDDDSDSDEEEGGWSLIFSSLSYFLCLFISAYIFLTLSRCVKNRRSSVA